jgi:hypothetical protein
MILISESPMNRLVEGQIASLARYANELVD